MTVVWACLQISQLLFTQLCLFATPWTAIYQASLSFTTSRSLLKFMSIESVMPSNHLILCCPLLLLPSIFPSIGVFSNEFAPHIRWPKYWSLSISPSSAYSGQISFRIDCCRGCEQKGDLWVWNLWKSLINIILQGNYSLAIQWLGLHPFTTKIPQATWHGQKEKKNCISTTLYTFCFLLVQWILL